MNLGVLRGARRLVLIGFDMRADKRAHFFGDHPRALYKATNYATFISQMSPMASDLAREGISVINCSRFSGLNFWPKMSLEEAMGIVEQDRIAPPLTA